MRRDDKVNRDSSDVTDVKEPADRYFGLFQIGEVVTTIPTIGFNVESVTYKNLNFNVWVCFLHLFLALTPAFLTHSIRLGPGWSNLHTTLLAMLLRKHSGSHIRYRLHGYRAAGDRMR